MMETIVASNLFRVVSGIISPPGKIIGSHGFSRIAARSAIFANTSEGTGIDFIIAAQSRAAYLKKVWRHILPKPRALRVFPSRNRDADTRRPRHGMCR